jgi:hypothetical protein
MELSDFVIGFALGSVTAHGLLYAKDYLDMYLFLKNSKNPSEEQLSTAQECKDVWKNNKITNVFFRGYIKALGNFLKKHS